MTPSFVNRDRLVTVLVALTGLALFDTPIAYPLRLFVVFLHELSHGLAAVATGGAIIRIELSAAEGGLCVTRGGSRFLTLNAGYFGSLLWGALLLVLGARSRLDRPLVAALGVLTAGVTLLYVRSGFGFLYGLLAGLALLGASWWLPSSFSDLLLRVLGTLSCLYAVWDIGSDVLLRDLPESDANALGSLTGIPGVVWAVLWASASIAVTALALRLAVRPARG